MTNPTPNTVALALASAANEAEVVKTLDARVAALSAKPVAVKLTKTQLRAVKAFAAAKRAEDKAKKSKSRWEKVIREALGDAVQGITEDGVVAVKVQSSSNSSFDRTVLREAFPEAFEATVRVSEYTFLKVL